MAEELRESNPAESINLYVVDPGDVGRADDFGRKFAVTLGFPPAESAEICLVVTELASNLLRHASRGTIRFSRVEADGQSGMQIESFDSGPGIPDVEKAITDGFSTAGGLGLGLGTVNRLMDGLEFYSEPHAGLHIVCQRWLRPKLAEPNSRELAFGAATRSYHRIPENGDTFLLRRWGRHALVGVIDGLGHGQFAQRASQTARQYIERHFDQPLDAIFRGAGRACRATRGVVMALARFDLARQQVLVASVGNIETRLLGGPPFNPIVRRGIVGLNAPNPVVTEHVWTPTSLLIMHSDGLGTHWTWGDFPDLAHQTPEFIARRLLQTLGKVDDDATVIVAGNSHS